jgi:hypothetical protein
MDQKHNNASINILSHLSEVTPMSSEPITPITEIKMQNDMNFAQKHAEMQESL